MNPVKHLKYFFTLIVLFPLLASALNAQSVATVTWKLVPPDSLKISSISGSITGTDASGSVMIARDYTGILSDGSGGPFGNFQRWYTNANWPDESSQNKDRYIQFSVKPDPNYGLNVSSVFMYMNAGGTSNMHANIYYSTDSSFSNPVLLNTEGALLLGRDKATPYNYKPQAQVNEGNGFYLRIYPWLPGGSDNTGKYVFLQSVIFSGSTFIPGSLTIPTVVTGDVTSLTDSSAVVGGDVSSDGGSNVTDRGICWNTTGNPTLNDNIKKVGSGRGGFSGALSGLKSGTKYYAKAYAINNLGTAYGSEISFTTIDTSKLVLAFPGAEGFGRYTTGGRGGRVLEVTNLNDDNNPGSLRWAVNQSYPRIIVFRISGTIMLQSDLNITHGDLTIAGQTAPGDGICIGNHTVECKASNVIVRYMRFRLGDLTQEANDSFWGRDQKNIIIDHCSFSWAIDEDGSWYDNTNYTMQWCIYSESLYHSYHPKGNHGYGGIWGGMGATFHHNLIADNSSRNPRFNGARYNSTHATEKVDFRNNVIFNWGFNSAYGGESGNQNMVNNYYKPGPATDESKKSRIVNPSDAYGQQPYSKWYVSGNYVEGDSVVSADNWKGGVQPDHAPLDSIKSDTPIPYAPVATQSAQEAYKLVIANAGCNYPKRDSADMRVINEVKTGEAPYGATYVPNGSHSGSGHKGIIDSQSDVGGWPELISTTPPVDTDHDGMPDSWETAHGLNPADSSDAKEVGSDGYTMIEEYINGLVSSNPTEVTNTPAAPDKFIVAQNYPNPFNPTTNIEYSLPKAGNVSIKIFSITGQLVKEVYDGYKTRGNYSFTWNGAGKNGTTLASGIYFCVFKFDNAVKVLKMQLLK